MGTFTRILAVAVTLTVGMLIAAPGHAAENASEQVQIEVVAYGPGLNMLRDDNSPVKDRLKRIKDSSFPSSITFSACGNTKAGMEKKEGHPIAIVPEASIVPSSVVRLTELQEQGWSYIRP